MASLNKVQLIGHAGRDPEIRYLPSGQAVANISIATTSKRKDKNSGETIEDTQWHRVQFFDRLAEIVGEYVRKGSPVYIDGRLRYGKYTDQAGVEKNTCDIVATELQLLGSRDQGGGQQQQQAPRQAAPQQQRQQAPQQRQAAAPQQRGGGGGGYQQSSSGFDDMDDGDIPFISAVNAFDTESRLDRRVRRSRV